jgi:APA family basic amino acid/polyamine antiporter
VGVKLDGDSGETRLDRPIGLVGATAMVIGAVIGMGIYALIAEVTAQVGTTIWLPFLLAMLVMMFGIVPMIQIAAALPRAGAAYVYTSRLLHPVVGTIVSWLCVVSVACTSTYVSIGMAGYIAPYLPFEISIPFLSMILPALFLVLYLFGLRVASALQIVLTALLILALLVYGIQGAAATPFRMTLHLPQGMGGLILASIICYSVWFGFTIVAEIGEEIRHAKRNIPLSVCIGGLVILILYIIVGTVFANSVAYDPVAIKAMTAPLKETGEAFLPPSLVGLISFGAVAAALTSFNATAVAMPREFFSQARDGIAPQMLSRLTKRTRSPVNAVVVYFGVVFVLLSLAWVFGIEIDTFAVMSAQGVLAMTVLMAVAALRLPKKLPEYYDRAYFRIPVPLLWGIVLLAVLSSLGFLGLTMAERPAPVLVLIVLALAAAAWHSLRVRHLKRMGVDWEGRMRRIPGYDEE